MQNTFRAGGRDIRIDLHEPTTTAPHPAIVLLHGAGGNIGFWLDRLAPILSSTGIALYAPHYFDRTGTQRADIATITDGIHVPQWLDTVEQALTFAAARPGVDPNRIAIVGISLGAFLSLALAARYCSQPPPTGVPRIRALIELSGGLAEPYAAFATRSFPPTLILHGDQDTVVPVTQARALDGKLTTLGVAHEIRILPGEGHWFSTSAQMQLLLAVGSFLSRYL